MKIEHQRTIVTTIKSATGVPMDVATVVEPDEQVWMAHARHVADVRMNLALSDFVTSKSATLNPRGVNPREVCEALNNLSAACAEKARAVGDHIDIREYLPAFVFNDDGAIPAGSAVIIYDDSRPKGGPFYVEGE